MPRFEFKVSFFKELSNSGHYIIITFALFVIVTCIKSQWSDFTEVSIAQFLMTYSDMSHHLMEALTPARHVNF